MTTLCLQKAEGPSNAAWGGDRNGWADPRAGGDCGRPRAGPTVASALQIRGPCCRQFQSRTGIREVPPSRAHGATLGIVCVAERLLGVRAGRSRSALCTTHAVCAEGRPSVCLAQHECARAVARGHTLSSCPAAACGARMVGRKKRSWCTWPWLRCGCRDAGHMQVVLSSLRRMVVTAYRATRIDRCMQSFRVNLRLLNAPI